LSAAAAAAAAAAVAADDDDRCTIQLNCLFNRFGKMVEKLWDTI
jgi:hypothetical protein